MLVGFRRFLKRHRLTSVLTKGILGIVVLAAVVVFGSRFWVEYRVGKFLERTAVQMSFLGRLSYGEVNANFDGRLTIDNLSFRPEAGLGAAAVPLIMEEAAIDFGSYVDMVTTSERDLPRQLELQFNGIRLDFAAGNVVSGNPAEALACGEITAFEVVDLEGMGFRRPRSNLRVGYRLVPGTDRMVLHFELATGEAASVSFETDLEVAGLNRVLRTRDPMRAEGARVIGAELVADARRFNQRRNEICAGQLGVTVEEAVTANVEAFVTMLANAGWAPEPQFVEQYRDYLEGEGAWRLSATPASPVDLASLGRVDDLNWLLERFNVRGAVGDDEPERFAFARVERPSIEEGRAASEGLAAVGRWVPVPADRYGAFVDQEVSISTITGKRYLGTLLAVSADEISLRAKLPGGQATVPIPRTQLRDFRVYEVYRPVDEEAEEEEAETADAAEG